MAQRWWPQSYPTQTSDGFSGDCITWEPEVREEVLDFPPAISAVTDSAASALNADTYKTIVICLDGTGDKFDGDNSNVVDFVACLKKDDPSQVTYYQSGIGTYDGSGLMSGISSMFDMAIGSGLGAHVKDAYSFLMQTYNEGDKICILGFSRGAYTARCLAGMIHKVGLLPAHNVAQIPFAYQFYKDDTPNGWKMSKHFKRTFCMNANVYFVGVWDCVASVGFIPRQLPLSRTSTSWIRYFRHAMSLDEHRAKFKICHWQSQKDKTAPPPPPPQPNLGAAGSALQYLGALWSTGDKKPDTSIEYPSSVIKKVKRAKNVTNALEVYFVGAHADVGGGAEPNEVRHKLSRIPLRWMIRQCFECNTGIIFNTAKLANTGIDIPSVWPLYKFPTKPTTGPSPAMVELYYGKALPPIHKRSVALSFRKDLATARRILMNQASRPSSSGSNATAVEVENSDDLGPTDKDKQNVLEIQPTLSDDRSLISRFEEIFTEQEPSKNSHEEPTLDFVPELLPEQAEDYFDAMANINDQLKVSKGWWILEFWPIKLLIEKEPGIWKYVTGMNLGRYRAVRDSEPKMHWTVERRINDMGYKVRSRVGRYARWEIAA